MYYAAKVAKQIVDYFTMALTRLEQGGNEEGLISDRVGTKIYKVILFEILQMFSVIIR